MPIHPLWLVLILILVLIIFGPGRLPELGSAVGKAMREFRKATNDLTNDVTNATQANAQPPAATSESAAKGSPSEANPPKN